MRGEGARATRRAGEHFRVCIAVTHHLESHDRALRGAADALLHADYVGATLAVRRAALDLTEAELALIDAAGKAANARQLPPPPPPTKRARQGRARRRA